MGEENPYETAARLKKVAAMVAKIDEAAIAKGLNPFKHAALIHLSLEKYTPDNWKVVDRIAKLKSESSPETRLAVKMEYYERGKKQNG